MAAMRAALVVFSLQIFDVWHALPLEAAQRVTASQIADMKRRG